MVSQKWSVDSHKNKYVNGKQSGQIPVGYQIYLDNPTDYLLEEDGNAFSPNYNIPDNQYFTIKTTGLGSYTLKKISNPSVGNGTLILSSRFNPTKNIH